MKNSLRIHKWTHNEFNIFILGVLTHPHLGLIVMFFAGKSIPLQCKQHYHGKGQYYNSQWRNGQRNAAL